MRNELSTLILILTLSACGANTAQPSTDTPASNAVSVVPADSRPLYEQTHIDTSKAVPCQSATFSQWLVTNSPPQYSSHTVQDMPQAISCCNLIIILGGPLPFLLNPDGTSTFFNNGFANFHQSPGCYMNVLNIPLNAEAVGSNFNRVGSAN